MQLFLLFAKMPLHPLALKLSFAKHIVQYFYHFFSTLSKTYLNLIHRQIVEFISFIDRLQKYMKIKRALVYSDLQKFFKRMPTDMFERITKQIIAHFEIKPELVAFDGS